MKCFLHIGTEKTATTTIQKFFSINRPVLREKGIIYTETAGRTNNRALSVAAFNPGRRDDYTKDNGLDSENKLLAFQNKIINNLKKEISLIRNVNSITSVIFSSEHFQSRLTDLEEIKRLKKIIHGLGVRDISVIVYLRRPAEIANSLHSTAIKAGNCLECPPSPKNPYLNNLCNHKNTLEKFISIFGASAMIPRLFDKNEFINGSIIDDILNAIGIPNDNSYDIPDNANESLSFTGIELLNRLNKIIPRWIDGKPNRVRGDLVSYIAKHFTDGKYIMPAHLYKEYDLEFMESNEYVRKHFFPEKKNIFSKEIPKSSAPNIPEAVLDKFANLIASIWIEKSKR